MCGIAGFWSNSNAISFDNAFEAVNDMISSLRLRGPDNFSVINCTKSLFFSHSRLSILDLTDASNQPIMSPSGRYYLSFNGEIYNFIELAKKFSLVKHASDTLVILDLFDKIGVESSFAFLNGMFSISVYDSHTNKLYLTRDRVGKKPLFYNINKYGFFFGSEIKSLLNSKLVDKEISIESVLSYLSLGYVPGTNTIYENIYRVDPGKFLVIDSNFNIKTFSYWTLPEFKYSHLDIDQIESSLREAVKIRLRSDVSVGVFLSGGIDSGLLTAFAAQESRFPLSTYTVSFSDSKLDESKEAKLVSDLYSTKHNVIRVDDNITDTILDLNSYLDEPLGDPSAVITHAVSKAASFHCKVVINGEGSDELFGGYRRFIASELISKLDNYRYISFPIAFFLAQIISPFVQSGERGFPYHLYRFLNSIKYDYSDRYMSLSSDLFLSSDFDNNNIFSNYVTSYSRENILSEKNISDFFTWFIDIDIKYGMTGCLLPKIDMATMRHSIEGRSPFLDFNVIETSRQFSPNSFTKGKKTKYPLRLLASKFLPKELVHLPKKGFEPPYKEWLQNELKESFSEKIYSSNLLKKIFTDKFIKTLLLPSSNYYNKDKFNRIKWSIYQLAFWESLH
ncbi:asparagine synthase (glutamine-hydrolyzing) [Alphaproteobacteria bacterium]|nr:asparagine synthase (glutamine-hydrolyzing) [Alphaproteobacteria bacterium]